MVDQDPRSKKFYKIRRKVTCNSRVSPFPTGRPDPSTEHSFVGDYGYGPGFDVRHVREIVEGICTLVHISRRKINTDVLGRLVEALMSIGFSSQIQRSYCSDHARFCIWDHSVLHWLVRAHRSHISN